MNPNPWVMTVSGSSSIDHQEVRRALSLLVDPEHAVMVQSLPSGQWKHLSGSDPDALTRVVADLADGHGTYFTLNPLPKGLTEPAKSSDVLFRRWFLVDIDRVKSEGKKGSATEGEKEAVRLVAEAVRDHLRGLGWPDPIYIDSGNGYHLLYRIDTPNDKPFQQLLSRCLLSLGSAHNTANVEIDKSVHDAKRISKIPGTLTRKGDNTPDRPWRMSRLQSVPFRLEAVSADQLKALAGLGEKAPPKPPEAPAKDPWSIPTGGDDKDAYARKALADECEKVATAGANRNHQLHESALKVSNFVASGMLGEQLARQALTQAAQECGLGLDGDPGEIARAINNGFTIGLQNPRTAPERPEARGKKTKEQEHAEAIPPEGTPLVIRGSKVESKMVKWLWKDRVPLGFIAIFAGSTGVGKSFITLDMAARVTIGGEIPCGGGECFPEGNVLVISEDPHEYVLTPRLIELGANMNRVFFMTWESMATYTLENTQFLNRAWEESGKPSLIVIDPPTNFLGGGIDEHKNAAVRKVLMAMVTWINGLEIPVGVVLITHVSKPGKDDVDAINRVIGSVAWVSTSRIAHSFAADPEDPTRRLFLPMKSNIGPIGKALAYRVVPTETLAVVEWLGEVETTANDAMSAPKPKKTSEAAACEWLAARFAEKAEWPSKEIEAKAIADGIGKTSLWSDSAKAMRLVGRSGPGWVWRQNPFWQPQGSGQGPAPRNLENVEALDCNPIQDNTNPRVPF